MADKFKVYLVNGTDQIVYDLKRTEKGYRGYSDEQCKNRVKFDFTEMHMYDLIISKCNSELSDEDDEPEDRVRYLFTYPFTCDRSQDPADYLNQEIYEIVTNDDGNVAGFGIVEERPASEKLQCVIKLAVTEEEYDQFVKLIECAGIDINDTRAVAVYLLQMAGSKVSDLNGRT